MISFAAIKLFFSGPKIIAFFGSIFKFVIKYWKEIIVISMLCVILYQNFWAKWEFLLGLDTIPNLNIELIQAQENLAIAIAANETLSKSINARNEEISQWKEVSVKLEEDNAKLKNTLGTMRIDTTNKINSILAEAPPETCEAAIEYLIDGRNDLQW